MRDRKMFQSFDFESSKAHESAFSPELRWPVAKSGYSIAKVSSGITPYADLDTQSIAFEDQAIICSERHKGVRWFSPLSETELSETKEPLFLAFAAIDPNKTDSVLAFCNRWGAPMQWEEKNGKLVSRLLFLKEIRKEIFYLRAILFFWKLVNRGNPEDIEEIQTYFTWHISGELEFDFVTKDNEGNFVESYGGFLVRSDSFPFLVDEISVRHDDWITWGKILSLRLVNERVEEFASTMKLFLTSKGEIYPHVAPRNLAAAIWWQVSEYIAGKIVRCAQCEKFGHYDENLWSPQKTNLGASVWCHKHSCAHAWQQQRFIDREIAHGRRAPRKPRGRPRKIENERSDGDDE